MNRPLLLDTHVVLWWLMGDPTLSVETTDRIEQAAEVYVSAASLWEIGIKQGLGKITGPEDLLESVLDAGFVTMPITPRHAVAASRLPQLHRDPFDRMLVAQTRVELLTLVTRDKQIQQYDVPVLPA